MSVNYKDQPIIFFPSKEAYEAARYKKGVKVGDAIVIASEKAYNKLKAALIEEQYQQGVEGAGIVPENMSQPQSNTEPGPEELN